MLITMITKAFIRAYQVLASILPYMNAEWEKLSIFLNFLIPKLPAPIEQDMSKRILESIDMDSYRAEVQQTMTLALPDEDAVIFPLPMDGGGRVAEPELDYLSNIIKSFNDRFGNIEWEGHRPHPQGDHPGDSCQGESGPGIPERNEEQQQISGKT